MGSGDLLLFSDWRGDPDQLLRPEGPTVGQLLSTAAGRGVQVKGLVWRSHLDALVRTAEGNRNLAENLDRDGGQPPEHCATTPACT